jgi:hypothetical protein
MSTPRYQTSSTYLGAVIRGSAAAEAVQCGITPVAGTGIITISDGESPLGEGFECFPPGLISLCGALKWD